MTPLDVGVPLDGGRSGRYQKLLIALVAVVGGHIPRTTGVEKP